MNIGNYWQPDEIQTLRDHARTHTLEQVAEMLGRSYMGVAKKAGALNLAFYKRGEKHQCAKYSDEQALTVIRRFYAGETLTQIAEDMGIPEGTMSNWTSGQQRGYLMMQVNGIR